MTTEDISETPQTSAGEAAHPAEATPRDAMLEFVQALAGELSSGQVNLPAFPDVALQVGQAVSDPDMTHARLARIVSAEAGLAGRILSLANSAAYARGAPPITDLKRAIARIGLLSVRNAAMAFSITQLRSAKDLSDLRKDLETLWKQSTLTAALAFVIARRARSVGTDDAMLAGLLHNSGKVYMLARARAHKLPLNETGMSAMLQQGWHTSIGQAISENWGVPEAISAAIGEQDALEREHTGRPDLTDVLIVAVATAGFYGKPPEEQMTMRGVPPFDRLDVNEDTWPDILQQCDSEIASLTSALTG